MKGVSEDFAVGLYYKYRYYSNAYEPFFDHSPKKGKCKKR